MKVHDHFGSAFAKWYSQRWGFPRESSVAMTIFNHIFYTKKKAEVDPLMVAHERVHVHQAFQTWWYPAVILPAYFFYYFKARLRGERSFDAYRSIPMERDAYVKQYFNCYSPEQFDPLFERGELPKYEPEPKWSDPDK